MRLGEKALALHVAGGGEPVAANLVACLLRSSALGSAKLTTEEPAEMLGMSVSTIEREWRFIRAWLKHALAI